MQKTKNAPKVANLQALYEWAMESGTRSITLEVSKGSNGHLPGPDGISIWVYDTSLATGQFIADIEDIDLEGEKEKKDRAEYEKLKARFEK